VRSGLLPSAPAFPVIRLANRRTGFFEAAQLERVVSLLPADVRPVVEFLAWTGWRKSEALGLEWSRERSRSRRSRR